VAKRTKKTAAEPTGERVSDVDTSADAAVTDTVDDIAATPDPPLSDAAVLTGEICGRCGIAAIAQDGDRKACTYCGTEY
jgi:hypothetical protein